MEGKKTSKHRYESFEGPAPNDFLVWSVLNSIFCSLIFGLVALYYSVKTAKTNSNKRNQDEGFLNARSYSKKAFVFNLIATVVGIISIFFLSFLFFYYFNFRPYYTYLKIFSKNSTFNSTFKP